MKINWLNYLLIVLIVGIITLSGFYARDMHNYNKLVDFGWECVATAKGYAKDLIKATEEIKKLEQIIGEFHLTDWESVAELRQFLDMDETDTHVFLKADEAGVIKLTNQCEDLALQLRDRAMEQGKYLSVIALSPDEYLKWYGEVRPPGSYHAICMARIGNEFWYVDPSDDRHWLALYLD